MSQRSDEKFEQALSDLPVNEDTRWLLKYLRDLTKSAKRIERRLVWIAGLLVALLLSMIVAAM